MLEEKILPYDLSMRLKKLGYNEGCQLLYTTAHLHNGEDLGSDEEFELRAEGHGDEIEYIPGGWIEEHYNRNDFDYLSEETCSAPLIHDVIDWFEENYNYVINPEPLLGFENIINYRKKHNFRGWHCIVFDVDSGETFYTDNFRPNRYEAITDGVKEVLNQLEDKKNGTDK